MSKREFYWPLFDAEGNCSPRIDVSETVELTHTFTSPCVVDGLAIPFGCWQIELNGAPLFYDKPLNNQNPPGIVAGLDPILVEPGQRFIVRVKNCNKRDTPVGFMLTGRLPVTH